jgi:methylated-DNA-[protein]-cysteine S-methyltransferase
MSDLSHCEIFHSTPLGLMRIAADERGICALELVGNGCRLPRFYSGGQAPCPLLVQAAAQLDEYFSGSRRTFSLPLSLHGTHFQQKVWQALCGIPFGQTRSYAQIAAAVDCPGGCRAVGMANHANPVMIFVPCHRVIRADGTLGGYGGGPAAKRALLRLEGISVQEPCPKIS